VKIVFRLELAIICNSSFCASAWNHCVAMAYLLDPSRAFTMARQLH